MLIRSHGCKKCVPGRWRRRGVTEQQGFGGRRCPGNQEVVSDFVITSVADGAKQVTSIVEVSNPYKLVNCVLGAFTKKGRFYGSCF